ncbi:DNA polymerase III, delta subunit [Sphingomonas gellani]|uniref:DNA-directed DNA polymerase n=1 Tax=Sphingomonas gellani TaxID=1166340 RepID=A0A1H8HDG3_9SPHN|nr:DNA polymerase III subunit delta [Sphingomonas gellani]SEN54312.1 DNA polymerase III, delta subunit [Sphingomonas gellani]
MKADATRLRAALSAPPPDIRLFLLHGPDEAGARLYGDLLAKTLGTGAERVDISPSQLRSTPALLADEAASMSLFEETRFIRVSGAGEDILEALALLLSAEQAGNPVLVIAPTVKTSAKIVKLAIDSRQALAHACYEPSAGEADRLVTELAQQAGLQPDHGVARRIAEASAGDRAVMAREVEKLALFLDAAPDRPKPLDHAAIDAIGADLTDADAESFATAVTMGHVTDAGDLLVQLAESGQSAIPWLRAIGRKLMMLADLRRESDSGGDVGTAMKRHRVHFTQEAAVRASLLHWPAGRIAAALDAVRSAERAIMAAHTPGDIIAYNAMLDMARRIARR